MLAVGTVQVSLLVETQIFACFETLAYKNAVFKAMKTEVSRIHGAFWARICSQGTHSTPWDAKRMVVKEFGEPGNSPYHWYLISVSLVSH